jgi:hypothetical protein
LSEHVRNARLVIVPAVPPPAAVIAQLTGRQVDAFALNRQRLDEIVRTSREVRILPDNFMVNGQAIVVAKGDAARLAAVNRFLTDVLASGFVRQSLEANAAAGVEVAPVPNP